MTELLVKWCGYDSDENTWEPRAKLPPEIVKEFESKRQKQSDGAGSSTDAPSDNEHDVDPDLTVPDAHNAGAPWYQDVTAQIGSPEVSALFTVF